MMFKIAIAALGLAAITWTALPSTAECAWCYSGPCYNHSICGSGCFCLKRGLEIDGICYSLDYADPKILANPDLRSHN